MVLVPLLNPKFATACAARLCELRVRGTRIRPSSRQRIGPQLEAHDFGSRALAAFDVERGAVAEGRPQAASLPAAGGIVDAAVHPFGVVAHGIGDTQIDPFA